MTDLAPKTNKVHEYYIGKKRATKKNSFPVTKITTPDDVYNFAKNFYHEDLGVYESFFIMMCDRQNQVVGWAKISQGGVAGTVVDIKIILKFAIECLASSIVMVHNHPSGNLKPSREDINITNKLKSALHVMDIKLLDHIIITEQSYNSIIDEV